MARDNKIPPSLRYFKEYHDANYQRLLTFLGGDLHIVHEIENFLQQLVLESDFCMRVRIDALASIIKNNEIKSSMEVGGGVTQGGKEIRKQVTKALFNADIITLRDEEYPKYGYLGVRDKMCDLMLNASMGHQYGEVIITFKKKLMLDKTTMTLGDSLNWGECYRKTPTFTASPKAICIKTFSRSDIPAQFNMPQFDAGLTAIKSIYDAIVSKKLTAANPFKIEDIFDGALGYEFFELQYHGKLIFDKVVASVDFCPGDIEDEATFDNLCESMKSIEVNFQKLTF